MTITQWIINGGRRCNCQNLKFKLEFKSLKTRKSRSINPFKDLILNAALGVKINKTEFKRYLAKCSKCDALYLIFDKKKDLMQAINETGIEIAQK